MKVREIVQRLLEHVFDGRAVDDEVFVLIDEEYVPIVGVEVRLRDRDGKGRIKKTYVLIVVEEEMRGLDRLNRSPNVAKPSTRK